jgi:hypothetical protein
MGCAGEPRKQKELDDRTAPILSGATKVEVFRIDGGNEQGGPKTVIKPGDPTIGGYAILSKGKDQTPEFAARLNDLLTDSRTYTDQYAACFVPGVAFRIWKGEECVDLVICFKCHNFYLGPPSDGRVVGENATFSGSPNARHMIRLAKDAFPEDQEIQELKDK